MDTTLGTEIGQKMRHAVKAKLKELGTGSPSGYIDDELPDYVMIMVANKRSRQQMVDDLSLFLGAQTEVFVNWLHQVLQKLQEVTLSVTTKPKDANKKKSTEAEEKRKDKKRKDKKTKRRDRSSDGEEITDVPNRASGAEGDTTPPRPAAGLPANSITDVFAHQYIEKAKKSLETDNAPVAKKPPPERSEPRDVTTKNIAPPSFREGFDIPSIAEIAGDAIVQKHHKELCELKEIEQRISEAKRHLKSLGTDISDEDDEDLLHLKANEEDLPVESRPNQQPTASNKASETVAGKQRQRITMASDVYSKPTASVRSSTPPLHSCPTESHQVAAKKRSVLDRLGSRNSRASIEEEKSTTTQSLSRDVSTKEQNKPSTTADAGGSGTKSTIISLSAHRREEREIYVPLFRRKESGEEKPGSKIKSKLEPSARGRSRERNNRETRSPNVSRVAPHQRTDSNQSKPRDSKYRHPDRHDNGPAVSNVSRPRERSRSREWIRETVRDRAGSRGRVNNGTEIVRSRIGSRVIVLPPKPEFNEDVTEVPVASVIKVQPRPAVPKGKHPSKNLLLKAMAEAQRSTVANLKKTIDNTDSSLHRVDLKRKLLIEISGTTSHSPEDDQYNVDDHTHFQLHDDLIFDDREMDDEDEVHEVDLANQVLMEGCDVDEEFKEILEDECTIAKPSGSRDVHVEPVFTKEVASADVVSASDADKDTKFVVTLDGAYKTPLEVDTSPSHTPPPPTASPEGLAKGRPSVKDRIGYKKPTSFEPARKSPYPKSSSEMEETLKKRKERFSEKLVVSTPATNKPLGKKSSSPSAPRGPSHHDRGSSSSRQQQRSPKGNSRSSYSTQRHGPSRCRTPSLSPERAPRPRNASPNPSRSKRTASSRNVSSSPSQLNELLMQRTKELMDDSVSSSPIYMSKSDYDKMEPSSRKRKRVSPIQFNLTDEDDRHDTDDDYHHHRDRRPRSREEHHLRRSRERDSEERSGTRKESRREWDRESERRNSREGRLRSPGRRLKKLESSRKFDDVPPLLSAVSLSGSDGKSNKGGGGGSIKERCKYFPSCRQGDACEFLHPTTLCKAFPGCKFGDKCLYLHPMCKYDQTCHRLDCNFMHTKSASSATSSGLSAPPLASSVVPVQNYKTISAKPLPPLCKYYPNCVNSQCQFLHPKMCRFGKHCANQGECNFYHYDIPMNDLHDAHSKDKFKWISPFSA